MKKELEKQLYDEYPKIFGEKDLPMSQTCMCWGLEVEDGWYKILEDLCKKLEQISSVTGIQTTAKQVKEKFAELRFYSDSTCSLEDLKISEEYFGVWQDIIDSVIEEACDKSSHTCECCGERGVISRKGGWYQTLCEKHAEEREYDYKCSQAKD